MKIYMIPTGDEYQLYASEKKKTLKSRLEKWVEKRREGRIKSTLEKYVVKMENQEELALKMAYSFEDVEVVYAKNLSEEEAKEKCNEMSQEYFKKSIWPMVIYGVLTPATFVAAPFLPVLNWGFTFYFAYKFSSRYRGIKGYNKILNARFVKAEEDLSLEDIIKKHCTCPKDKKEEVKTS